MIFVRADQGPDVLGLDDCDLLIVKDNGKVTVVARIITRFPAQPATEVIRA